jgi:MoxR-like ATPase
VLILADELNRADPFQMATWLHALTYRDKDVLAAMGIDTGEYTGPFVVVQIHGANRLVWAPAENVRVIAAGNLGAAYRVQALDPALADRFESTHDFPYLAVPVMEALLREKCAQLSDSLIKYMAMLAAYTQSAAQDGTLTGAISTRSLLNWGKKLSARGSVDVELALKDGLRTWGTQVCGRFTGQLDAEHLGVVDTQHNELFSSVVGGGG